MRSSLRFLSGLVGSYTVLTLVHHVMVVMLLQQSPSGRLSNTEKEQSISAQNALPENIDMTLGEQRAQRWAKRFERWNPDGGGHDGDEEPLSKESAADNGEEPKPLDEQCGWLPPFGDVTIRHPRREATVYARPSVPTLLVSYEADRLFASPLDGMTFDGDSTLYVFLDGQPEDLEQAVVTFTLDRRAPWTSVTGAPFDLFGLSNRGMGPDGIPLRSSDLGAPACHRLVAKVRYSDGSESEAHASFRVERRRPKTWLITTVSVNDFNLIGFFLDAYVDAGVSPENMVIIVHANSDKETDAINQTVAVLRRNHVRHVHVWVGMFNTFDKFELQESFARRFVQQQDWVMHPDVDEHHRYPGDNLHEYIQRCNERGITAVFGVMQDRVAPDGQLAAVRFDQPLAAQFPLACSVTHDIVGGATSKVVLHRGFLMAEEGGYHTLFEWKRTYGRKHTMVRLPPTQIMVDHFKWTATLGEKIRKREQEFKAQGIRWWVQSARLRRYVNASGGALNVKATELDCREAPSSPSEKDAWPPLVHERQPLPRGDTFTVILMSHSIARRANQLFLLRYFANMRTTHEVVFVWNGPPEDVPTIPRNTVRRIRLRIGHTNSLNNRWNESIDPRTDAVLMVDDDSYFPEHAVMSLFARWQHDPNRIVGVVGRTFLRWPNRSHPQGLHTIQYMYPKDCCAVHDQILSAADALSSCTADRQAVGTADKNGANEDTAPSWCGDAALNHGTLTLDQFCDTQRMVLPKGMFFHRKFLEMYSLSKHARLREYVDNQGAHCDDVAFNFLVANHTGLSGVVVDEEITELMGSSAGLFNGSSSANKAARLEDRSECTRWIADYFGGKVPPPFRIEPAGFHIRLERAHRNPVVWKERNYSVMWNLLGKCIAENGQRPN